MNSKSNNKTAKIPKGEIHYELAELYRIFADTTRIKILHILFESEICVGDLAENLNMTVSAISHQLRVLKNARLVKFRKQGKTSLYSLADDHVKTIIEMGMEHITE
ncbi:MAG: metalloregulator ArsR/SmtB family transcription factor [Clostridia bacterium]|nr:metalloregulator ArsR/SmtB family transcription factor [Clostridia bacterium]